MQLIESKSILAKLMATENITVEQRNTKTAMFDTKNRILTVPILDKEIPAHTYDLFMGHEVGHALYTPSEEWVDALKDVPKSYVNILEDSRIERKIRSKYPGLKSSFYRGYQDLMDRDFFGVKSMDLNDLNFIDRVNMYEKCGAALGIEFNEEERDLLKEIQSTQTFTDVVELAKKIHEYMKDKLEEQNQDPSSGSSDDDFGDDWEEVDVDAEGESKKSFDGDYSENEKSEAEEETDDSSSTNTTSEQKDDESLQEESSNQKDAGQEDGLESLTDENYRMNEHKLFSETDKILHYVNLPVLKTENIIVSHKELYKKYKTHVKGYGYSYGYSDEPAVDVEGFQKFKKESSKVVSYLVKEFELRKNADQMKKASVSKTGELNMERIFSYKYSEDLFKKVTVIPGAKSHGLVMFIDWSGSMANHMQNTMKQLLNLALFCKKVNIPFEVYAFVQFNQKIIQEYKHNDLVVQPFRLMNLLSSKMSTSEFNYAGSALIWMGANITRMPDYLQLNSTPLNDAIIAAMQIVPEFQKMNKLQVVNSVFLTDGESDYISQYYNSGRFSNIYSYAVEDGKRKKVEVVVRDPITKQQVVVNDWQVRDEQTEAFVKLLKLRTRSNILGFFVLSVNELKRAGRRFFDSYYEDYTSIHSKFSKEKSLVTQKSAFDEYYLIKSDKKEFDEDEEIVIKSKTTKSLVTAFTKFTTGKVVNRSILTRFIGLIA